jgi:chemotaxis protein MotB
MTRKDQFICVSLLVMSFVFIGSCVSKKDYLAKVDEAEKVSGELTALQSKYNALMDEKSALEEAKNKLQMANADQEKEINQLNQDKAELEKILQARSDTLSKNIVDLRANIADLKNDIKRLNEENADLQNEIKRLNGENADLQNEIKRLNEENAGLRQEAEALERQREKEVDEMKGTYENLLEDMKSEIEKGKITITQLKGKLRVNMLDEILFDSGKTNIKPEGLEVLDRVGKILFDVKDRSINIEGHTDNVPIGAELSKKYPTNWELSAARATNVARYLQEKVGIAPELLSATGYGEYHPVSSNDTPEGKAKNRRIEIILVPQEITPVSRK